MPIDPRDPTARRTLSAGRCYLYVAPCMAEDLAKIGFSRDPIDRLRALHPRWFEFFDIGRIALVEGDTVREARAMETRLHRQLAEHNTNAPLTIQREAAGHGEWYRGTAAQLEEEMEVLRRQGYGVHAPATPWLREAMLARCELLYAWASAELTVEELVNPVVVTQAQRRVRDALDAFAAFDIEVDGWLPEPVLHWYSGIRGR